MKVTPNQQQLVYWKQRKVELDEDVKTAQQKIREFEKLCAEEWQQVEKPQPDYKYIVKDLGRAEPPKKWDFERIPAGCPKIQVTRELQNVEELRTFYAEYGKTIPSTWLEKPSMKYFLHNGVLLHYGGGTLLLKEYALVKTEREWRDIVSGNIPESLENPNCKG